MKGRMINNAYRVKGQPGITSFFPYLSRTRTESVVYFTRKLDVTDTMIFLNSRKRNGERISLFNLVVTAAARTAHERPIINRFVLGRKLYQREIFDVSYVIKQNLSDDGKEILLTIQVDDDMSVGEIASLMNRTQEEARNKEESGLDRLMNFFGRFPRPVLRAVFAGLRFLDFHGCVPAFIRGELPFYCTLFISNLGSIGVDAPFHHLYELGTTSLFLAFGQPYLQTKVNRKGEVEVRKFVNMNFTVDERICDGYNLARSFDKFIDYLESPETLFGDI